MRAIFTIYQGKLFLILTAVWVATAFGAESDRRTPEATVDLETFLRIERGTPLEKVRAVLKMPGTHEFTALIGDSEYVCVHFLFREPRIGFYLVFTNAHLK